MHPQTSLSNGRQTSAQASRLHFSDQFICLSLVALLAAFFFLFAMPKFELSLHHIPARPIGQMAHNAVSHPIPSLIAFSTEEQPVEAVEDEAGMSAADLIDRWQPYIEEASQRFAVPSDWIRAVIRIESGGRTMSLGEPITSGAGAMGVMQLMRDTYDEMRERHDLGPNPYDVRDNILAGTAYLRELYTRYGYPKLFAAYNAGPGTLEKYLFHGARLPAETRAYLSGVVKQISQTCVPDRRAPGRGHRLLIAACRRFQGA